jgi:hypothetical protein
VRERERKRERERVCSLRRAWEGVLKTGNKRGRKQERRKQRKELQNIAYLPEDFYQAFYFACGTNHIRLEIY